MSDHNAVKRALKRAYLDATDRAGVYAIRHLASGRLLVDGAANAQAALNRHAFELRLHRHRVAALQQDWDADGEGAFAFEMLDVIVPRDAPGFDLREEIAALVALWRAELGAGPGYAAKAASTSAARSSGLASGA